MQQILATTLRGVTLVTLLTEEEYNISLTVDGKGRVKLKRQRLGKKQEKAVVLYDEFWQKEGKPD